MSETSSASVLWRRKEVIGDCTLYLGDSRQVAQEVGLVDAVVSDPPYGMLFQSNYRAVQHRPIANDGDVSLLKWACRYPVRHSRYVFCRWDNLADVPKPKSVITWVKNNWSMGDLNHEHARQTEVALFYPGGEHRFPKGRPTDVVRAARTGNNHHPTEKPEDLMATVVGWTEGLVFDPFMGSGTTGVACMRLGRPFVGVELDETYFETACARIREVFLTPSIFDVPPPASSAEPQSDYAGDIFGGGGL